MAQTYVTGRRLARECKSWRVDCIRRDGIEIEGQGRMTLSEAEYCADQLREMEGAEVVPGSIAVVYIPTGDEGSGS